MSKQITKEQIVDLYINQNLPRPEVAKILKCSQSTILRKCKEYNIIKPKELSRKLQQKTCVEKYGVVNPLSNKEIQEKIKETNLQKYGVECTSKAQEVKEKQKNTNIKKYGGVSPLNNKDVKEKAQNTLLKKYGVHHPIQNDTIKNRIQETNIKKYGVKSVILQKDQRINTLSSTYNIDPQNAKILVDKQKFISFIKKNEGKTIKELSVLLTTTPSTIGAKIRQYNLQEYIKLHSLASSYEQEIKQLLSGWGINFISNDRNILPNHQEIDIYCPSQKIGIEFNGNYWHSTLFKEDRNYHFNKSKSADSVDIRLIHIYEYEWINMKDKIISLLKIALGIVDTKIYARACKIKQITNKEAMILNNKVHLQGHRNAQITYGLYYKDELVQLMSFSRTKYNKNLTGSNDWEIIRGCPGSNNIVIGGVSKIFSHFIKDFNPDRVFSYCDFNKFNGKSYEALGMKFIGYTGPDKTWLINGEGIKRSPSKHKEYKEKAEATIWGAGSKKYL